MVSCSFANLLFSSLVTSFLSLENKPKQCKVQDTCTLPADEREVLPLVGKHSIIGCSSTGTTLRSYRTSAGPC